MGHYNSFILRVWSDGEGGWTRGYMQHVNSQERAYFTEKEKMDEFIMSHLGPPPSPPARDGGEDDLRDLAASFEDLEGGDE